MAKPRIVLADDHTLVAEGIAKLLLPEFDVVGKFSDGRTLLEYAPKLKPDVVLLDLQMPLLNGIDAGQRLKEHVPNAKIIVLTVCEDTEVAASVLHRWASGYLLKKSITGELIEAIRAVLSGKSFVTTHLAQKLLDRFIHAPSATVSPRNLTDRQREVLQLLVEGKTLKEIANILELAPRTVAYHKYRIMQDFGLKSNSDLVLLALREHIISPSERLSFR